MDYADIPYWGDIVGYVEVLKKTIRPRLILLHGSVAKGTFGVGSDVDILVVAENLPKNPNERMKLLYDLDTTRAPIDVKAYTPAEFSRMLAKGHPLVMDALEDGKVLHADEAYLREVMSAFRAVKKKFRRVKRGWIRVRG